MASLDGKVAFITGAARGQGRAEAVRLASDGANVIAVDICDQIASVPYPMATPDDLAQTVKLVEDTGARIVAREADVRDHSALSAALQAGLDEFGRLDIVIANAGIAPMQSGGQGWRDVVDVNLTGGITPSTLRYRRWSNRATGASIVLTSSAAGLVGWRRRSGLTRLHGRQARRRRADAAYANHPCPHRIRVNTIHPTRCQHADDRQRFTRKWLERIRAETRRDFGNRDARAGGRIGGHRRLRSRGWYPMRPATSQE